MLDTIKLEEIMAISMQAGEQILDVYHSPDFQVEKKGDDSPLTLADKRSNEVITRKLQRLYPEIPILSEEGNHLSFEERKDWDYLWIVDPLDGTKEFIKRNDEFTVNIALVHQGRPVLGVIYTPVLDTIYAAKEGVGSYKLEKAKATFSANWLEAASQLPLDVTKEKTTVIASRSHLSSETEEYIMQLKEQVGDVDIISAGSSLKLCLVAEGKADVYPRFAPTMEWDTAAGQAIVEQSGAEVVKTDTQAKLTYNKENLLNPWFIVKR